MQKADVDLIDNYLDRLDWKIQENSNMSPADARSMRGRLRLDVRHLGRPAGGLFECKPLTGPVGPVRMNTSRPGDVATDKKDLVRRLDRLMEMACGGLRT